MQKYANFMARNCDDRGNYKVDNMTRSERAGIRKLMNREKEGADGVVLARSCGQLGGGLGSSAGWVPVN